jgi:hypothetical protein
MLKQRLTHLLHLEWVQVVVTFWLISLVRFFPIFFQNKTFFFGDNYSLLVPGKLFSVSWLLQGIVPLWNPLIFSGITWVGDISQSLFYPSTLFFFLPTAQALSVTVIVHLFLTMIGMYLLAKWLSKNHWSSLLVSVLWMVSSQVTGSANNLATLQSLTWLPWVLYAAILLPTSRNGFVLLTTTLALNLLAGYPQHILLLLPIAIAFSLIPYWTKDKGSQRIGWSWKRWFIQWVVSGLLTLGITAFVFFPFVEALLGSTRTIQTSTQAARGSLHPAEVIKLFIPYFFDAPVLGLRWGPSWNTFPTALPYLTWFGLATLGLSIRKLFRNQQNKLIIVLTIFSFVISFGSFLPGFDWMLNTIPGMSAVRYPSSWLVITNLSLLLLLSQALPTFSLQKKISVFGSIGLGLIFLSSGTAFLITWLYPEFT